MNIKISRAKLSDKDFILYANKEIDKASYIEKSKLSENIVDDLFKNKKCVCLIAREGTKNIGMVLFSKVYWADRGIGIYISQVFVEKDYRQKGVFKKLLFKALNYYKNTNFITCLVSRKNKSMVLCMTKMGFEDEGMISYARNKQDLIDFDGLL